MATRPTSRAIKVDFGGVETRSLPQEGPIRLQVDEVEIKEGKKAPYVSWKFKTRDGSVIYDNTSMSPKALWRLKAVLEALGETGLDAGFNFQPRKYLRKWLNAELVHESYQGRKKAVIESYVSPEAIEESGEEDETQDDNDQGNDSQGGLPIHDQDLDDEIPF